LYSEKEAQLPQVTRVGASHAFKVI